MWFLIACANEDEQRSLGQFDLDRAVFTSHSVGTTSVMSTQIQTRRARRTWIERLMMRRRAYLTKIVDRSREVTGRGSTPEASLEAAERRWEREDAR
jgi:hypothetical protein